MMGLLVLNLNILTTKTQGKRDDINFLLIMNEEN
jgi:hypothetical protein